MTDDGERRVPCATVIEPRPSTDRFSPFVGMINPVTRQRAPEAAANKRVLDGEVIYPFDGQPDRLTRAPPLDAGIIVANGFPPLRGGPLYDAAGSHKAARAAAMGCSVVPALLDFPIEERPVPR